jgi:hypothetical protein
VPSLDLRFADNKSLVDAVTGQQLVTHTRASSKTVTNSAGVLETVGIDVPAFDHNPITGESLGLLVEEQRANLRTYSDAMLSANTYGATNSTLTTVSIANPFGGTTASLLTLNVGANTSNNTDGFNFGSGVTLANSTAHAQFLFVKPAGATVLRLRSNVGGALFDFTLTGNGTAPSLSADLQSASIVPFRDGWYRVSWTFTSTTTAPGNRGDYWTIKTNVADGTNGLYVVGAQLEAGALPTSYIPTTTAAVTRSADVASITGSAFSSWYRQDEGTVFAEFGVIGSTGATQPALQFNNGTDTTRIMITRRGDAKAGLNVAVSNVTSCDLDSGVTLAVGSIVKTASAYKLDDFAIVANASSAVVDTSGSIPTNDRANIGSRIAGTYLNGTIRRLTFWGQRLPNNILQSITQ